MHALGNYQDKNPRVVYYCIKSSQYSSQLNESCCGDETRVLAAFNTVINNSLVFILIIT